MLSILIPTYNQDITRLVKELHRQATEQYIDFEIIIIEDGSTLFVTENDSILKLENCRHIVLTENIGRSATRNKLADEAKYEHLLFMDCDAEICSLHYIEKYITFCKDKCIVIGGTSYDPKETNASVSLRLKYGRKREARTAMERNKSNFATFNFLITKSIFNYIRFNETIRGYGHEDMLFGHQLHQLGFEFTQIENPLIHKGLDDNLSFIRKTEEGTKNLYLLHKTANFPFLEKESTLLRTFIIIEKLHLARFFAFKYDLTKKILRWLLCRKSPSLLLYDLYKILFMCKISLTK